MPSFIKLQPRAKLTALEPRALQSKDTPALLALSSAAGWNQTAEDWRRLLRLQPDGCFGCEVDGQVVASATVLCYGRNLAWLGMVLTLPAWRGRGFARTLVDRCLEFAGARALRLDASEMGQPLYEELGFVAEYPVERWRREARPGAPTPAPQVFTVDADLDRDAFGADRGALLHELRGEDAAGGADGFALGRPGANAAYFGPCVCRRMEIAAALVDGFVAHHAAESIFWDLFPANTAAAGLARSRGFRPDRTLLRMVRGATPQAKPDPRIMAIAGFEYG